MRLVALLLACACASSTGDAPLMRHVRYLASPSLDGRKAGSDGERAAVAYVTRSLVEDGLAPATQDVPIAGGTSANVWAEIPGRRTDEAIVVGAHLDHLGHGYPGADDDASGVAIVLEIARALAARRGELDRKVIVVFFGDEEDGLVGSQWFVGHPPVDDKVVAMVNLDMEGRALQDQPPFAALKALVGIQANATGIVGVRRYPRLRALADQAFAAEGGSLVAAEDLPDLVGNEVEAQAEGRSDSASFEDAGIPALFFGDGESSDYHQPGDTPGKLDVALLAERERAVLRVVLALSAAPAETFAASEATPPKREPASGWWVPVGFVNGLALDERARYLLGGELGLVHFDPVSLVHVGVSARIGWRPADGNVRVAAGPEVGVGFFGAGALGVWERGRGGVELRPYLALGPVGLEAALGFFPVDRSFFGELALVLEWPVKI